VTQHLPQGHAGRRGPLSANGVARVKPPGELNVPSPVALPLRAPGELLVLYVTPDYDMAGWQIRQGRTAGSSARTPTIDVTTARRPRRALRAGGYDVAGLEEVRPRCRVSVLIGKASL